MKRSHPEEPSLPPNKQHKTISLDQIVASIKELNREDLKTVLELSQKLYNNEDQSETNFPPTSSELSHRKNEKNSQLIPSLPSEIWSEVFQSMDSAPIIAFSASPGLYEYLADLFRFRVACSSWNKIISELLLNEIKVKFSNEISMLKKALYLSCVSGNLAIFKFLFDTWNVKKWCLGSDSPLQLACQFGNSRFLKELYSRMNVRVGGLQLLQELCVDVGSADCLVELPSMPTTTLCLESACKCGFEDVVKVLLRRFIDPNLLEEAIYVSVTSQRSSILKLLLSDKRVHVTRGANFRRAVMAAAADAQEEMLDMLLNDERLDHQCLFDLVSCEGGVSSLVERLLALPDVDPSRQDQLSLLMACQYGHLNIVKLLLNDPRVKPEATMNAAISNAASQGNVEVVELLLSDPRVDASDNQNFAIRIAALNGHVNVVQALARDPRVTPQVALCPAIQRGQQSVVSLLLKDPRVVPEIDDNAPITFACTKGQLSIVKLLLNDPRVSNQNNISSLLIYAVKSRSLELVKWLCSSAARVFIDPSQVGHTAWRDARDYGFNDIADYLLNTIQHGMICEPINDGLQNSSSHCDPTLVSL